MTYINKRVLNFVIAITLSIVMGISLSATASASQIDSDVQQALEKLYEQSPSAKALGETAKGILVFPSIVKGGFIVGGQYGEGALIKNGEQKGRYNTVQISYGLQAGLQKYGYVLFLMTYTAMKWLDKSNGWELGVGPTIVVVDKGKSSSLTSTTAQPEIYAYFFDQTGLMGGLGIQGTKISKK